jgi:hypothetical protein
MAEQMLFTEGSRRNVVFLKKKLTYLSKVRYSSWIDIGYARRTGPDRRLRQSDPFLRDTPDDHSPNPSIPDRGASSQRFALLAYHSLWGQ